MEKPRDWSSLPRYTFHGCPSRFPFRPPQWLSPSQSQLQRSVLINFTFEFLFALDLLSFVTVLTRNEVDWIAYYNRSFMLLQKNQNTLMRFAINNDSLLFLHSNERGRFGVI